MAGTQEPHRIQGVSSSSGSSARVPQMASSSLASSEKLVNELILKAYRAGASDLHLEPNPDHLLVRARIDGVLQPLEKVPGDGMKQAITRLKIMANLDNSESRTPVDGRFNFARYEPSARDLDVRATFVPTFFGEKAVLRLVDHSMLKLSLEELGFTPEAARLYQGVVSRPSGIVLHIGPQGSGKTTTAYAGLKNVPRPQASVVTIEETIEYVIPGLTQVQLNPEFGLGYKNAIQGVVRQDADVILVGELKDAETTRVAIEAALSGRLVLSTLHATSASAAVARLVELGFPRAQVAHAMAGVVSQRLVRRLCVDCRERISPSTLIRSALVLPPTAQAVFKGKGCRKCGSKGFRGRVALFEVTNFTDRMREAVASGQAGQQLDAIAISEGTIPLLRDAVEKVLLGSTSVEEVLRALIGIVVDDVSAITEPGEMVNFLKTVRDQFMPPAAAPAPTRPSSGSIPLPSTAAPMRKTQSFPAAMLQEEQARPPSGRFALPEDLYKSMPVTSQPQAPAPAARATSSEELLRSIVSSLPPDVAASLARATSGQQPVAPPRPTTTISPELLRQLQELQKRLGRPGEH
jgi:type II secretory ATPase GspE/PulE/Tfp pilus assembly ATPase PilB-like protein